jgi:hypothetical protein
MLSFKNLTYTLIGAAAIVQLNLSPVSAESLRGRQQRSLDAVDSNSLHGCSASAGYTYCESTATCIRPWMTACPVQNGQGFSGAVTMECTDGQCDGMTSASCSLFDINNDQALNGLTLVNLNGDYFLKAGCTATCNNCIIKDFPNPITDGHGCLASAGYSYCPETDACIRFDENCPIEGGTEMYGSKELTCADGARMSNLTSECKLVMKQSDGTTITLAGPYITLDGTYVLPEGCSANVVGCTTQNLLGSF